MAYPNVIYGDYGDEKVAQSTKIGSLPLGQLMILSDGRKFRHSQAGSAAALSAGVVVSTTAGVAAHGNVAASGLVASASTAYCAKGITAVHMTAGSVAMTKDMWEDGYLNVQDDVGEGHVYKVKENTSCAASADVTITLYPTDPLAMSSTTGTTTYGLRKNQFKDAILFDRGTVIAPPIGATPVAVSASFYFWCQRSGPASLRTGAITLTDGCPVVCASATAGSVTVTPTTADTSTIVAAYTLHVRAPVIGYALETVTATEQCLVDMCLE